MQNQKGARGNPLQNQKGARGFGRAIGPGTRSPERPPSRLDPNPDRKRRARVRTSSSLCGKTLRIRRCPRRALPAHPPGARRYSAASYRASQGRASRRAPRLGSTITTGRPLIKKTWPFFVSLVKKKHVLPFSQCYLFCIFVSFVTCTSKC